MCTESGTEHGHSDVLQWLISSSNKPLNLDDVCRVAAANGRLPIVQWLVTNGRMALHEIKQAAISASERGHVDTLRWLMENGADVTKDVELLRTILHRAAVYGHLEVIKVLHANYLIATSSPNAHIVSLWTEAANHNNVVILQWLAENQFWPNQKYTGSCVRNTMYTGASKGHLEVVRWAVAQGADVTAGNNLAITYATGSGKIQLVQWLLQNGAQPQHETVAKAFVYGHTEMIQLLTAAMEH